MNHLLSARFHKLSELLGEAEHYWRPNAFYSDHLPWMDQQPTLVQRLFSLSPQQIEKLSTDAFALSDFLASDIPIARELSALIDLPTLPSRPLPEVLTKVSPHFSRGIPGRKWQQLQAFASCIPQTPQPLLEWCAGKSHLGFFLHCDHGQPVTALEWNEALVTQANQRAARDSVSLSSHKIDVLDAEVQSFLQGNQQVVALHACGELHERLLRLAAKTGVKQLHIAPCCYHKRREESYTGFSTHAAATALVLDKKNLHTAVSETATARAGVQRQRVCLQIMRLGFDCLQREVRGIDEFLPIPSLPMRWAQTSFEALCRHCAQISGITLPDNIRWQHYYQLGEEKFWRVSALDLVRFLFRRPLEVWLVLDRALFLQEHGYDVQVGLFCPATLTPRNLLIQAILK